MATQVQWRGGSTDAHTTFIGAQREITVDTDKKTLVVHDGSTAGGGPLLREDQANLPSSVTNGLYTPGTNQVALSTNGTGRISIGSDGDINIDSGGVFYDASTNRLAIGTTSPASKLHVSGDAFFTDWIYSGSSKGISSDAGIRPLLFGLGGSEKARIDSSGRLLVGTSSSASSGAFSQYALVQVRGNSSNAASSSILSLQRGEGAASITSGESLGLIDFADNAGNSFGYISCDADGTAGSGDYPGRLVFSTTAIGPASPTSRMAIYNNGSTGVFTTTADSLFLDNSAAAGTTYSLILGRYGATELGSGTVSFRVWNNGNVVNTNNSYGAISDIKLKENIVDANSQWNDLKALQVRNYNFKEGQTHTQIGLIAQEVELVSPGLVSESPDRDEDGNDLGTVTKSVNYSVLYMKAVKALQEAMERIETLEAKVAALESA